MGRAFSIEDGIRDFCLSRGLGDVYKRQAFDGAFEGVDGYANCIGKSPTAGRYTDPTRFRQHKKPLLTALGDTPYTTLADLARETSACDTPEHIQDNHEEPSEHVHEGSPTDMQDMLD